MRMLWLRESFLSDGKTAELELKLIQPRMAQKPMLRGEVNARA